MTRILIETSFITVPLLVLVIIAGVKIITDNKQKSNP